MSNTTVQIERILNGYQFSVDNFKPGDFFTFKTFSPAMLDSMVKQLEELVNKEKIKELARLTELDRYTNRDSYAKKRITELAPIPEEPKQ